MRIDHPVYLCGFRPFFVLTAASALILMPIWLLMLQGIVPGSLPGGSLLWHGHELIFGFVGAAIAGFALTSVPEFTRTPPICRPALRRLAGLWLAARVAYALSGLWPAWLGLWPAALLNLWFFGLLLRHIAPAVWQQPQRRHISFAWAVAALLALEAGFFMAVFLQMDALAWLRLAAGLVMVMIVLAASRVSMAVVNRVVERGRPGEPDPGDIGYVARPPRRKLAIFCIAVCSLTEFALGHDRVTGWTALAAAAAMLNLLNDWHIGRAVFTRWALLLYGVYALIAAGYALMGASWLDAPWPASAGRHVLTAGAMGLSIFIIMNIAGRIHAGRWLDRRAWIPASALVLVLAAGLRAIASTPLAGPEAGSLLLVSGLLWAACFGVYLALCWPVLTGPRTDGQNGCSGPRPASQHR